MNVRCPECARIYRVNPALVPAGGVRARCSCSAVLTLGGAEQEFASVAEPARAGAPAEPVAPALSEAPSAPATPAAVAAAPAAPAPASPEPVSPAAAPEEAAPARPRFGAQDPDSRARRIARALVSDMVVYNPERRDTALAAGTLRMEFKDEILKSWNEYVEQVGEETARGTAHFRNALNDLLAKGEKIF